MKVRHNVTIVIRKRDSLETRAVCFEITVDVKSTHDGPVGMHQIHFLTVKMAALQEDYFVGDDFEAILSALEENILESDPDLAAQMDLFSEDIGESESMPSFQCNLCAKVCKTKRGLSRHTKCKHPSNDLPSESNNKANVKKNGRRDHASTLL